MSRPIPEPEPGSPQTAFIAMEEQESMQSPWREAAARLVRTPLFLVFTIILVVVVGFCIAAPLWAEYVAETGPDEAHLSQVVTIDGKPTPVVSNEGVPIGPTWQSKFFLGADSIGRDLMVRLLYGGRTSLLIGVSAAIITTILGVILGILAGYSRGWVDAVLSRIFDVIWAFPAVLLGVALGVALALGGLKIGPVVIQSGSLLIPIIVISVVYIPYLGRPVRGQILSLREKEFVDAARVQGAGPFRIMFSELLPNLASTILVFFTLLVANAILLEASLSFLGAGVQPPQSSWGTLIQQGVERITSKPTLTIFPGAMLVLTVLSLNAIGDAVREELDPHNAGTQA